MNITHPLLASFGMLIVLSMRSVAEIQPPTFRETADRIIISGTRDFGKGPLPWTIAIKKSSVKSVTISTDDFILSRDTEAYKTKRYESPEEIQKLPAIITIVSDELKDGGANMTYDINGLNHASAPAMLEKILGATSNPGSVGGTK